MFLFLLLTFSKLLGSVKTISIAILNHMKEQKPLKNWLNQLNIPSINIRHTAKHKSWKEGSDFKVNIISTKVYHK